MTDLVPLFKCTLDCHPGVFHVQQWIYGFGMPQTEYIFPWPLPQTEYIFPWPLPQTEYTYK